MNLSRSELKALLMRAARGANVPLSQGVELSNMLASLAQDAFDGLLPLVVAALEGERGQPTMGHEGDAVAIGGDDPLQSIPAALDFAQSGAQVSHAPSPLLDRWAGFRGFAADGILRPADRLKPARGHLRVDRDLKDRLDRMAGLTYVPSTPDNRAGAGAGDIDND